MNANAKSTWVDPDDAPELTDELLDKGKRKIAGQDVSAEEFQAEVSKRMGRPPVEVKRPTLNMRVDPEVLEALKAVGKGWQSRVNAILRNELLGGGRLSTKSEQLLADLDFLQAKGWTIEQVREMHHWAGSPAGKRVTFSSMRRYFGKVDDLRENNLQFANRVRAEVVKAHVSELRTREAWRKIERV